MSNEAESTASAVSEKTEEQRLIEQRATLIKSIEELRADLAKKELTIQKMVESKFNEQVPELFEQVKAQAEDATKRIDRLTKQLEGIDRAARVASFSGPFLKKLGIFKTDAADLLPKSIFVHDLEAKASQLDAEAKKIAQQIRLISYLSKAVEAVGVEFDDETPALNLAPVDGGVSFSFAASATRAKRERAESGPSASRGVFRIVSVSRNEPDFRALEGAIVGNHPDAKFTSFQSLYEAMAPAEIREKLDKQSRSKREWFEKYAGAVIEAIETVEA